MKKVALALAAFGIAAGAPLAASAHHSAAQFDFGKSAQVTGVVKKIRLVNPHMSLVLEVSDAKGKREIEFEGHSLNNMYRAGWRNDMVKVGDTMTVNIAPLRDGNEGGYVTSGSTKDGKSFGGRSSAQRARDIAEGRAQAGAQ